MVDADCRNLFATVSKDQVIPASLCQLPPIPHVCCQQKQQMCRVTTVASLIIILQVTVYDDMHMEDHIAVVANMALSNSPEGAKVIA